MGPKPSKQEENHKLVLPTNWAPCLKAPQTVRRRGACPLRFPVQALNPGAGGLAIAEAEDPVFAGLSSDPFLRVNNF